jgi:SAM-dependent methyltransferase
METSEITKRQREIYGNNFQTHGDTPQGVFWNNEETQNLRFARLVKEIPQVEQSQSFSIHDVGCGTTGLHEYLLAEDIAHEYSGTEIVPEMVAKGKEKFPTIEIYNRDITHQSVSDRYDYVALSGVLNLREQCPEDEWVYHCKQLVSSMFSMSRYGMLFNFMTSNITIAQDPTLQFFDPAVILKFCHDTFSRFVLIDHSYPLFEVTATVFTLEGMRKMYPEEQFAKYLK